MGIGVAVERRATMRIQPIHIFLICAVFLTALPRADAVKIPLWPLLYYKSWETEDEVSTKESDLEILWPILKHRSGAEGNKFALRPLWKYEHSAEDGKTGIDLLQPLARFSNGKGGLWHLHLLTLFWGKGQSVNYRGLAPFYIHVSNRDGHGEFLWLPPFARYSPDTGNSWTFLGPFGKSKKNGSTTTYLTPFIWKTDEEGLDSFTLFPVLWWWDEGNSVAVFPLFGTRPKWSFFLFPLYLKAKSDAGVARHFLFPLVQFGGDANAVDWRIRPLLKYYRGPDKTKINLLLLLGEYNKSPTQETLSLANFFQSKHRTPDGDLLYSTRVLYPIFSHKSRAEGTTDFTLLDPFWFLYQAKEGEDHFSLFGIFSKRKTEKRSKWRVFPFFKKVTNSEDKSSEFSVLWRVFSWKTSPEKKKLTLFSLPVYKSGSKKPD